MPHGAEQTPGPTEQARATASGLVALLLWSATIPVARRLSEALGTTTAAAAMLLLGGAIGLGHHALRGELGRLWRLPPRYLGACGGLFVGYMVCLYLAVGMSSHRQQVVEVGVLNYLWPALTLLLAVVVGGARVRTTFWPSVLLALVGAALAPLGAAAQGLPDLWARLQSNPWPYALATAAAVCWALYSVLGRRWAPGTGPGAVALFTLASGTVLGLLRLAMDEVSHPTAESALLLVAMAVGPVIVAYALWDIAVRRGNLVLVATASYAAPVVSTLLSAWILDVEVRWTLWLACALVSVGALGAHRSLLRDAPATGAADP